MKTFDFPTLITILVTIAMGYLAMFFSLKKEIDDFRIESQQSKEVQNKIIIRKRNIKYLNIFTIVLLSIIIILYLFPNIINTLNGIQISSLDQNSYFYKLLPFKEGFFENRNFKYSYVTGIIFSVFIQLGMLGILIDTNMKKILKFVFYILFFWGQIWVNYFISLFLISSISKYFWLLSFVINFVMYIMLFNVGFLIIYILSDSRKEMSIRDFYKSVF